MHKKGLLIGAWLGLTAVAIGAFGAHGLKALLLEYGRLEVFETAARYQMYHALAILLAALMAERIENAWIKRAIYLMTAGVLIFSGSLYALSLTNLSVLGAITPLGGVMLIGGWFCVILAVRKKK